MTTKAKISSNLINKSVDKPMSDTKHTMDLLIIGAGPVGLTAALEAHRLGISVRIIDRKDKRSTHDSRAVVVHPRVMELLQPINNGGVVQEIQNSSFHLQGAAFYIKKWFGMKGVKNDGYDHLLLNLSNVEWGDTEYPNLYFLPQYETERVLEQALNAARITVEYGVGLDNLSQANNSVTSVLLDKNGTKETVISRWVLGSDGGRSKTRELVSIELNRHRSDLYFIVADVVFKGDPPLDSHAPGKGGHIFPTDDSVIVMFPHPGSNSYRLLAQAPKGVKSKDQVDILI
jgi:2-polyprenyl-6-methoxyphenol hydroxylase-like FAD-dependent oxidoreductase